MLAVYPYLFAFGGIFHQSPGQPHAEFDVLFFQRLSLPGQLQLRCR